MNTTILSIDGMSCGHCVKAVTLALQHVPGVTVRDVQVGRAVIETASTIEAGTIASALDEAGYTLAAATEASPRVADDEVQG